MPKKRRAEEYEDDEGSPSVRSKKVRKETAAAKKKNLNKNSNKDSADVQGKKTKGKKVPGNGDRDGRGEEFWEVSIDLIIYFFFFLFGYVWW